jgi:Family of unknown function (DUF6281)
MRLAPLLLVLTAGLAAGCSQASEVDCANDLDWNGARYTSYGTAGPPPLGEALGEGSMPACDDGGGGGVGEREVTVFAVEGVDPEAAVALEGFDGVYLAPAYGGSSPDFPPVLERLVLGPRCSEPGSFVVEGDYEPYMDRIFTIEVDTTDAAGSAYQGLSMQIVVADGADVPSVPLSRYGTADRMRARIHCRTADSPQWTYVTDEVSFLANGWFCGRYGEPCHRSEGPPHPMLAGGSAEQRALLGEIVEGIGPSALVSVTVTATDRGVELAAELGPDADLRGEWEAWLVAGAFRDRSHELGLPAVVGLAIGDDRISIAGGPWSGGLDDPRALSREVHGADGRSSVHFDEYALLQPAGVVPAITFKVGEEAAAAFLKQQLPRFLEELGDPWRYEGFYFRVESPEGEALWEWAGSSRLGAERTEA